MTPQETGGSASNTNSSGSTSPTGPRVNDQFWFDWSYDIVKNSLDNIDKNVASIDKIVLWAYGIYTTSSIITLAVKQIDNERIIKIMALPYLFLILSYWLTNAKLLDEKSNLKFNEVETIIGAYKVIYQKKLNNLFLVKIFSLLGLVSMAITLMIAFVHSNRKVETEPYLSAKILATPKNTQEIAVTGRLPKSTNMFFTISRHKKSTTRDSSLTIYSMRINTPTGNYMTSFPLRYSVPDSAHKYTVKLEWNDSLYTRSLQKIVLVSKPVQTTTTAPRSNTGK